MACLLLLEANPDTRQLYSAALEDAGFCVYTPDSSECGCWSRDPDLVIIDLQGKTPRFQTEWNTAPTIALDAKTARLGADASLNGSYFSTDPVDPETLVWLAKAMLVPLPSVAA